jgi:putative hydrolase of the HAD superfamily
MRRQHLILDADDTLWENNIFFEQAFEEFADFLDHRHLTREQVRDVLDSIEAVNAKIHGYGSKRFGRNLVETYHRLAQRPISDRDLEQVVAFAEKILDHPIILLLNLLRAHSRSNDKIHNDQREQRSNAYTEKIHLHNR